MDNYEVEKQLGRGAFGVATLVKEKRGGRRPVYRVIKTVDLRNLPEGERDGVHNEVGVLRQLEHPHIVALIDSFVVDLVLNIVMEYADGGDLSNDVKKRREEEDPFSETEALKIFGQCLKALEFIHGKLIMHRDLKCQNIFKMKAGAVKLGDFGISKVMEHSCAVAGTMIGTPAYLAPEIVDGSTYTSKVDIWAMGIVLYELLALKQPFQGAHIAALAMRIVSSEPPALPDTVGKETTEVVLAALRKNPEERPSADVLLKKPVVHCALEPEPEWSAVGMEQFVELEQLGRGAFGVALLVRHRTITNNTGSPYKVVKKVELSTMSPSEQAEAQAEVAVLRRLSHPHIVAYFNSFIEHRTLHIVLEYADDGDLNSTMKKMKAQGEKSFPEREALMIFGQCLHALKYVHAKHIMHRDLKCQNIFRMKNGDPKLGDFGISKVMEHTAAIAGTVIGTPAYLAPEMIENRPYDNKVDVWSMGVVLYELIAFRQPFHCGNIGALVIQIVTKEPPPLPPTCSTDVSNIVMQAMRKNPEERPSAHEMLLNPVVGGLLTTSDFYSTRPSSCSSTGRRRSPGRRPGTSSSTTSSARQGAGSRCEVTQAGGIDDTSWTMTPMGVAEVAEDGDGDTRRPGTSRLDGSGTNLPAGMGASVSLDESAAIDDVLRQNLLAASASQPTAIPAGFGADGGLGVAAPAASATDATNLTVHPSETAAQGLGGTELTSDILSSVLHNAAEPHSAGVPCGDAAKEQASAAPVLGRIETNESDWGVAPLPWEDEGGTGQQAPPQEDDAINELMREEATRTQHAEAALEPTGGRTALGAAELQAPARDANGVVRADVMETMLRERQMQESQASRRCGSPAPGGESGELGRPRSRLSGAHGAGAAHGACDASGLGPTPAAAASTHAHAQSRTHANWHAQEALAQHDEEPLETSHQRAHRLKQEEDARKFAQEQERFKELLAEQALQQARADGVPGLGSADSALGGHTRHRPTSGHMSAAEAVRKRNADQREAANEARKQELNRFAAINNASAAQVKQRMRDLNRGSPNIIGFGGPGVVPVTPSEASPMPPSPTGGRGGLRPTSGGRDRGLHSPRARSRQGSAVEETHLRPHAQGISSVVNRDGPGRPITGAVRGSGGSQSRSGTPGRVSNPHPRAFR
eukprot:TRINITY_DN8629_c0_g1_i1.p1 TRINITY_DN8629_c0_g1~~TRINITY_DN8629_c0_g1_i1.p1  ORF type:complete len:1152 (+),score=239.51 TRINITY_DN8629_c0_g1_i1:146-3601(+)